MRWEFSELKVEFSKDVVFLEIFNDCNRNFNRAQFIEALRDCEGSKNRLFYECQDTFESLSNIECQIEILRRRSGISRIEYEAMSGSLEITRADYDNLLTWILEIM